MRKRLAIKVEGLDGAINGLIRRGVDVEAILEVAVHAGAQVVREIADANAPASGIIEKETAQRKPASVAVDIGVKKDQWFLQFFETGATEHEIQGNPLVFQGDVGIVVTSTVDHPGMAAEPFLRPALDGQKDHAVSEVGRVIKSKL